MTLKQIAAAAAAHYADRYSGGLDTYMLLQHYAVDELNIKDISDSELFAENAMDNEHPEEGEEMKRFLLWYYCNKMVEEKVQELEDEIHAHNIILPGTAITILTELKIAG